jgi:hypothetical protein
MTIAGCGHLTKKMVAISMPVASSSISSRALSIPPLFSAGDRPAERYNRRRCEVIQMVESGVVADEMFVVEVDHRSGEATDIIVTVSVGWSGRTIGRG